VSIGLNGNLNFGVAMEINGRLPLLQVTPSQLAPRALVVGELLKPRYYSLTPMKSVITANTAPSLVHMRVFHLPSVRTASVDQLPAYVFRNYSREA